MPATQKISVTIGRAELRRAKQLAPRLGLSLSAFISDAVRQAVGARERQEAGRALIATFAAAELPSTEEMRALLSRWGMGPLTDRRSQRTRKGRSTGSARAHVERRSA